MMYFTDTFSTKQLPQASGMSFKALAEDCSEIFKNLKNITVNLKSELVKSYMSEELRTDFDECEYQEKTFKSGDIIYFCQPIDKHNKISVYGYRNGYDLDTILDENRSDLKFKYFRITIQ